MVGAATAMLTPFATYRFTERRETKILASPLKLRHHSFAIDASFSPSLPPQPPMVLSLQPHHNFDPWHPHWFTGLRLAPYHEQSLTCSQASVDFTGTAIALASIWTTRPLRSHSHSWFVGWPLPTQNLFNWPQF